MSEQNLLSPAEVAKYYESLTSYRPSLCTVYRWFGRGVAGVSLNRGQYPHGKFSTKQDVEKFIAAVHDAKASHKLPSKMGIDKRLRELGIL